MLVSAVGFETGCAVHDFLDGGWRISAWSHAVGAHASEREKGRAGDRGGEQEREMGRAGKREREREREREWGEEALREKWESGRGSENDVRRALQLRGIQELRRRQD